LLRDGGKHIGFGSDETTPIRDAARDVNAEELAEHFDRVLEGWDERFLKAKNEIEFARAAAHLHLAQGRSGGASPKGTPTPRLVIKGETVLLDGKPVILDMTLERRREAILYLKCLEEAKGNWLSDGEIERRQQGPRGGPAGEFHGVRWDHVRSQLSKALSDLIETQRRKGSRLVLSPPPRRGLRK
jgi:hypothetical protein